MHDRTPDPRTPRPSPFGLGPTGLSGGLTLALGLALLALLFVASLSLPSFERESAFERPIASSVRVLERRLELQAATERLPGWERTALAPFLPAAHGSREDALRTFEALVEHRGWPHSGAAVEESDLDGLRARRAALLWAAGRPEEAQGDLDALAAHGQGAFVIALRHAVSVLPDTGASAEDVQALELAGDGWIGRSLRARAAGAGEPEPSGATRRALDVARAFAALLACGVAVLLAWAARNRPEGPLSSLPIPAPWTADAGFGVLVRAAFLGLAISIGLQMLARTIDAPLVAAWSTLFAALPLLRLVHSHLLAPGGLRFADAFGLHAPRRPMAWVLFVLGLFALDQVGRLALDAAATALGAAPSWSEGCDETLVWAPTSVVALQAVDVVLWAPVCMEIAFRGVLYATLRKVHGPLRAALLCGALFGAVQLGSLPSLLALSWSGFVWALAVERTRSLWPAIACHALAKAFAAAGAWALYR